MQSLKIKTTLRILTTAFAVIPMLIVGIVGYFSMTGFAANSVSQFARAAGAAQQEINYSAVNVRRQKLAEESRNYIMRALNEK